MTAAERHLIAAIHRYLRAPTSPWHATGWACDWQHTDGTRVTYDHTGATIRRPGRPNIDLEADSVTQLVDLLAAYRLLPPQFTSGWFAARWANRREVARG